MAGHRPEADGRRPGATMVPGWCSSPTRGRLTCCANASPSSPTRCRSSGSVWPSGASSMPSRWRPALAPTAMPTRPTAAQPKRPWSLPSSADTAAGLPRNRELGRWRSCGRETAGVTVRPEVTVELVERSADPPACGPRSRGSHEHGLSCPTGWRMPRRWRRRSWPCWRRAAAWRRCCRRSRRPRGARPGSRSARRRRTRSTSWCAGSGASSCASRRSTSPAQRNRRGDHRRARRRWRATCSAPPTAASERLDQTTLAVIGMGKLGGDELNYASDVDVLLVGEGDPVEPGASGAPPPRRGRQVLPGRRRPAAGGSRRSARAEPGQSYEAYWERWAEPWERQALLQRRARWLATRTSAAAGWRLPRDRGVGRALRGRRAAPRAGHEGAGGGRSAPARGVADREVKRGPGGIRDVEFAAQLLQLVHGRVDPELRSANTLAALPSPARWRLRRPETDAAVLADSYRFLRRVEHALQLEDERQTHTVPDDRARRRRLARVLGFRGTPAGGPTEPFDRELAGHRGQVRAVHERVWFRPLLDSLSGAGPLGPRRPLSASPRSASPTSSAPARRWSSSPVGSPGPRG